MLRCFLCFFGLSKGVADGLMLGPAELVVAVPVDVTLGDAVWVGAVVVVGAAGTGGPRVKDSWSGTPPRATAVTLYLPALAQPVWLEQVASESLVDQVTVTGVTVSL